MNDHGYRYADCSASDIWLSQYLAREHQRQLEAKALEKLARHYEPNMGRRQAAFARAREALAERAFGTGSDRLAAEIALAKFFAGDA